MDTGERLFTIYICKHSFSFLITPTVVWSPLILQHTNLSHPSVLYALSHTHLSSPTHMHTHSPVISHTHAHTHPSSHPPLHIRQLPSDPIILRSAISCIKFTSCALSPDCLVPAKDILNSLYSTSADTYEPRPLNTSRQV